MVAKLQQLPELARRGQRPTGRLVCRAKLVIDRDTASRFGITPAMIDEALYDAYGQRQVSTMFTQLNQYHVVLEVEPGVPTAARDRRFSTLLRLGGRPARSTQQVPFDARSPDLER